MSNVRSHSVRSFAIRLPPPLIPALLNNRWMRSVACCAMTSSRKRSTSGSRDTSATCTVRRTPCGSPAAWHACWVSAKRRADTSHVATWQPSATNWRTSSRPMPDPPPVTTAILPETSCIDLPHPALHPGHISRLRRGLHHLRTATLDREDCQCPSHLAVRQQRKPPVGADITRRLGERADRIATAGHDARDRRGIISEIRQG